MKTRRGFLQVGAFAITANLAEVRMPAQEGVPAIRNPDEGPNVNRDYWNDYPNHLSSLVNAARKNRISELAAIKTSQQAQARASFVHDKVWQLIGGKLEKTPLNVQSTGITDCSAYRIEKLIFESQPEFYVPANLYLPKSGSGPFPGIISPLGHTPEGKNYKSYQTVFQNLARKGFVVLTWDPPGQGERLQYPIPGMNRSLFGPTGEHDQFGWPAFLVGSTVTQFETWDAIRALDYLLTRPEVDHTRIGCCGHSGGGTATMFLSALEPRIQVAVVVEGHTENVAGENYQPPGAYADAEQNLIGGLKLGIDRGDLLAAFAPKPLLICFSHMDVGATYSPHYEQGTKEIYHELKNVYSIYNSSEDVALSASNLPHDYDFFHRRATYEWFNKHLAGGKGDDTETPLDDVPDAALNCTSTGQILSSVGGRTAYNVNYDRLRAIQSNRASANLGKNQVQQKLREILGIPYENGSLKPSVLSRSRWSNVEIEEFQFESGPAVRIPGWFLKPVASRGRSRITIVLASRGKNHLFSDPTLLADVAAANGTAICAIDTRASGQNTPRFPSAGPLFYGHDLSMAYALVSDTVGAPLMGQRVWDLLRCLDYLASRDDVAADQIGVLGRGSSGLEALFGAVLDPRVKAVFLEGTLADYRSVVKAENYDLKVDSFPFGLLKHFDLPELSASIAPRPIWLMNPAGANGEPLSLSETMQTYATTAQTYAKQNAAAGFSVHVDPNGMDKIFRDWLKTELS